MNNSTKILLTVVTEGGTLSRQSNKEYIKYYITKQDLTRKELPKDIGKQIVKSGRVPHYPLVAKPCTQHIKMSEDTYNHFLSDYCPAKTMLKSWKKMTPNQRLEWHLQRTCEHFGGISYSYEIMED